MDLRQWDFRSCGPEELSDAAVAALEEAARLGRQRAVTMTAVADSGHPAGSLSSMEMYLVTYGVARLTPENATLLDRDHVVVSHGHTSPGAYAALAAWGFVDGQDAEAHFRDCGSPFSGHVERNLSGVDWSSGNLGQGLAAGVGYALAARARKCGAHTFVLMGDGGQTKGQSAEARRIARKEHLADLTVLVDCNGIQISGATDRVMPADLEALWKADGWRVLSCDGHDVRALYRALREARNDGEPTVIFCRTVMGKGVSFMEGKPDYHGKAPSGDLYAQAMRELSGRLEEIPGEEPALRRQKNGGGRNCCPSPTAFVLFCRRWIWESPKPMPPQTKRTVVPPSARCWPTWEAGTTVCRGARPCWSSTATWRNP